MNIANKFIQAFRAPVPLIDRVLEVIALFLLISMLIFTAILYQQAPEQIPIKFNGDGEPISWADKIVYWYMAIFFVIMVLISAATAYDVNFKMVHVPFRIKEPVRAIQQRLFSRMSRCVTICLGLMWLAYLLHTSAFFLGIPLFAAIFSKLSLFILLVVIVYFSVKSWWVGRRY